jgi:DnaJ like chaperone protein
MSIWSRLAEVLTSITSNVISSVVEAVRTLFSGDPETRKQVAFSVALIALSAKMAKADGVVTHEEVSAFREIFDIPEGEERNVARLYDLAKQDVAGFESYAARLAEMCTGDQTCRTSLEDVLDGLFHIAKADGGIHERELHFLATIAEIFGFSENAFERILSRHAVTGEPDPYIVLGIQRGTGFAEAQKVWRDLVKEHHPDRLAARGLPPEFAVIANERIRAINAAWNLLSPELKRAELVRI